MEKKLLAAVLAVTTLLCVFLLFPKIAIAGETLDLMSVLDGQINDFTVSGKYLYLAKGNDLEVYDISNLSNPQKVGNFHDECAFMSIDVLDPRGYVTQVSINCWTRPNGFTLLDLHDPSHPTKIGEFVSIDGPGMAVKVIGDGNYAYVADAHGGLYIVDLNDLSDLKIVGTLKPNETDFRSVEILGDTVFAGDSNRSRLYIVNVADRSHPQIIGEPTQLPPGLGNFDIADSIVYLAVGHNGISFVDVSESAFPLLLSNYDMAYPAIDIKVSGKYAFVANDIGGISVLDVSDIANIQEVTNYNPDKHISSIKIFGNLVLAHDPSSGLCILKFSGIATSEVEPFLDLPWDYSSKGLSFSEAALAISSYFDHEYPFGDVGSVLAEPEYAAGSVSSFRGDLRNPNIPYSNHDGYDWLRHAKVLNGDPVLASADGIATFYKADKNNGACGTYSCGNVIVIDHQNGYQTRYYHLQDNDPISESFATPKPVTRGQQIGKVGSTGRSTAPHIHFSVIQDKNKDGNFQDNRPDGLVDPFGWQSKDPDPWPIHSFSYKGIERAGTVSKYLWINPIAGLNKDLPSGGGLYSLEKYSVDFPSNPQRPNLKLNLQYSTPSTVRENVESIGNSIELQIIDASGNQLSQFYDGYDLSIDFNEFDISRYQPNTTSFYSSSDGVDWTKENSTEIDWVNKIAKVHLTHASYLTLAGEKKDFAAPYTEIVFSGMEGKTGWFRSDVKINLTSSDSDGSGVYYTGYKIDDNYFQEYSEPVVVTNEGEHVIEYYSVDESGNVENIKNKVFHIDKKAPEMMMKYDPIELLSRIEGVDENSTSVAIKKKLVTVVDLAGNRLEVEGIFDFGDMAHTIQITSLRYNDAVKKVMPKSLYNSEVKTYPNGKLISINQSWHYKNLRENLVTTNYRENIDATRVRIKDGPTVITDSWLAGQHLLSIETNSGNLDFRY